MLILFLDRFTVFTLGITTEWIELCVDGLLMLVQKFT
jgi:hypothetical protein